MTKFTIEKSSNNESPPFVHYFYLEALCRIGEVKTLGSLFDAFKSPEIDAFRPRDSIICLLKNFKDKLSSRDLRSGIIHTLYNPRVTDDNIISLNIFDWGKDLIDISFALPFACPGIGLEYSITS